MLKLSDNEALVLQLLSAASPQYGLELVRASDDRLRRGTVYVLLDRMERKGLISSEPAATPAGERGPARRTYRLTGLGERAREWWEAGGRLALGFAR